jgi:hypothetical protein
MWRPCRPGGPQGASISRPSSSTGTRTTSCRAGGGLGSSGGRRPRCSRILSGAVRRADEAATRAAASAGRRDRCSPRPATSRGRGTGGRERRPSRLPGLSLSEEKVKKTEVDLQRGLRRFRALEASGVVPYGRALGSRGHDVARLDGPRRPGRPDRVKGAWEERFEPSYGVWRRGRENRRDGLRSPTTGTGPIPQLGYLYHCD